MSSIAYLVLNATVPKGLAIAATLLVLGLIMATSLALLQISKLRRDLWIVRKSLSLRKSNTDAKLGWEDCSRKISQLCAELDDVRSRMEAQERSVPANAPAWPNESLPIQLNRRGQILRLAAKGKSIAEIATDLGVSKGEVALLLKVHDLNPSIS